LTLITTAYVNTYGGEFRHSILRNRMMQLMHGFCLLLFFGLLWTNSNRLNCVFRVNCDTKASVLSGGLPANHILVLKKDYPQDPWLAEKFWSGLAFWSAGGLGKCFMGPQIRHWQEVDMFKWLKRAVRKDLTGGDFENLEASGITEMTYEGEFVNIWDAKRNLNCAGGCDVASRWTPDADSPSWNDEPCRPYWMERITDRTVSSTGKWTSYTNGTQTLPINPTAGSPKFKEWEADEISTSKEETGCEGPNNCYPFSFKVTLTTLLLVHMIGHHLYVKFIMHGSIVERLRKQRQEAEEVEMRERGPGGAPLVTSEFGNG